MTSDLDLKLQAMVNRSQRFEETLWEDNRMSRSNESLMTIAEENSIDLDATSSLKDPDSLESGVR